MRKIQRKAMQPLDYIFSRDILNEGVDIVEVNQAIMLRPTQSPIVFIQQLGRGRERHQEKSMLLFWISLEIIITIL
ncbi:MAG: helicase-related protein [Mediterraneibacter faecis]